MLRVSRDFWKNGAHHRSLNNKFDFEAGLGFQEDQKNHLQEWFFISECRLVENLTIWISNLINIKSFLYRGFIYPKTKISLENFKISRHICLNSIIISIDLIGFHIRLAQGSAFFRPECRPLDKPGLRRPVISWWISFPMRIKRQSCSRFFELFSKLNRVGRKAG